ncbi:hypothetical protein ASPWEDRAFT_43787 [Aspergillus wentii DTO 134E9]|uniref:Uncharacterized protein n=1 Tax=Aspergillus wentii DTO 134E9 TaxID=1073089 RepID=A0A1L9RA61_ASPWE|nr:uncharacterized protein ASPWEDRAFT_43787 [Aspergillus wentii DTO 134E9]KAI9934393.1 hypothetical protein MW887_000007 [Aspergillus wentii]OJJ31800.1 hypothetical protein ASPWEDRAFT_43787 [Aspergillus wentii DTO 134E9]
MHKPTPSKLSFRAANPNRARPQRVIDARSLAASQNAGQPANIIRGPRFQKARGSPVRARKPRTPTPAATAKANPKNRKELRTRASRKQSNEEEGDATQEKQVESVFHELEEKARPVPSRYSPRASDFSSMKETWPSLPTNVTGRTAGVFEKLSWLSDRYPNGYVPPHELGRRLFRGQNVQFFSEEEKAQAVEEAKKLAQQHADKLSQIKGDLVEPKEIGFSQINAADRKALIETLVQGSYPKHDAQKAHESPIIDNILMNLRNNETYQTTGKGPELVQKVQSLLTSSRPIKRA